MAHYFQKISAPFGRKTPNDRMVDTSIYAKPWVEMFYNYDVPMYASEKIDGTSVGIVWDGERISFVGHTDKSQFAPRYLEYLKTRFLTSEFESSVEELFGDKPIIIFGEGISKDYNESYGYDNGEFIFYDVKLESGKFIQREALKDIAEKLGLIQPHEEIMSMKQAIDFVCTRSDSFLNNNKKLEGLVLRPTVELYTANGERIITKIKVKDFVDVKDYRK